MRQPPQAINLPNQWRQQLALSIKSPQELLQRLCLPDEQHYDSASNEFPLRVPLSFVARMRKGDRNDPLLRQVLPLDEELNVRPGFSFDPVGDLAAVSGPGVLQKYRGRVLLMTTASCGIHCRYCFRRHFPYAEHSGRRSRWQEIARTIAADNSLNEVILSGGDPLSLDDTLLKELLQRLSAIPHIKRIRIHSRFPIIVPQRIDASFLNVMATGDTQKVFVIHSNHANEINAEVQASLMALNERGVTLLNQSVLLKGVNDNVTALSALSERLFECKVMPYYLHMLDKVQGAAHFDVEETRALKIMMSVRQQLPGYLVPSLVREEAGLAYKQPV